MLNRYKTSTMYLLWLRPVIQILGSTAKCTHRAILCGTVLYVLYLYTTCSPHTYMYIHTHTKRGFWSEIMIDGYQHFPATGTADSYRSMDN